MLRRCFALLLLIAACTPNAAPTQMPLEGTPRSVRTAEAAVTTSQSTENNARTATPYTFPLPLPDAPAACEGLLPTRLTLNARGRVTEEDNRSLNVRAGAGTSARILSQLFPDETFVVLEGPLCADGYTWYRVRARDGRNGWAAEGNDTIYYVEPYPPR